MDAGVPRFARKSRMANLSSLCGLRFLPNSGSLCCLTCRPYYVDFTMRCSCGVLPVRRSSSFPAWSAPCAAVLARVCLGGTATTRCDPPVTHVSIKPVAGLLQCHHGCIAGWAASGPGCACCGNTEPFNRSTVRIDVYSSYQCDRLEIISWC